MSRIISAFSDISAEYDVALVDLWGCLHNGITAYPQAVDALVKYRDAGGIVVLLTNSPKPRAGVEEQLARFGVPPQAWDTIATSGDSARTALFRGHVGTRVWFMGEWERDAGFFDPIQVVEDPVDIRLVDLDAAEGIVCCGPFDPSADPAVNRPEFLYAKQKGLKLLCANPDIVVDRGEEREWCAGALARLYTEMGGESLYFGKPHPPIYDLARRRLAALGLSVDTDRIIAIGDGIQTDIRGAMGEGIDSLFITGGLAARDTKTGTDPDPDALRAYTEKEMMEPTFAIGYLR